MVAEDIHADDGLLESRVCGLHQVVVNVLLVAQRIQTLHVAVSITPSLKIIVVWSISTVRFIFSAREV